MKNEYVKPSIKVRKMEENLMQYASPVSGTNLRESPSQEFGKTHETGGSGVVLSKGGNQWSEE